MIVRLTSTTFLFNVFEAAMVIQFKVNSRMVPYIQKNILLFLMNFKFRQLSKSLNTIIPISILPQRDSLQITYSYNLKPNSNQKKNPGSLATRISNYSL